MQRPDKPDDAEEAHSTKTRPSSRRNSAGSALSRKSSAKRDNLKKSQKSPNTTPSSTQSTPKKTVVKPEKLDFMVTGKQLLKRCDRANSLPGVYHRRTSSECLGKNKMASKRHVNMSESSKSRDTSLEDDMSLDFSQVSDFEDTNSKYGLKKRFSALATSTPKPACKPRSGSLQGPRLTHKMADTEKPGHSPVQSSLQSCRESYKTSSAASHYRYGRSTELDYSSVSPEYSGQSSADLSPRTSQQQSVLSDVAVASPYSQRSQISSSSCYMSWVDSAEDKTKTEGHRPPASDGEWNCFWANYNNSVSRPINTYYDQCPTPYRTENIETADLVSAAGSRRSPATPSHLNRVIRTEGLQLTPRETQNLIKCAHILGNVLSKAIDRSSRKIGQEETSQTVENPPNPEVELKKKTFTLDLRDQNKPLEVETVKTTEDTTTQTDISLPNTKSAPKIFEKILRQLSKTSLDDVGERREAEGGESEKDDKT